jgi:hypothetical protein
MACRNYSPPNAHGYCGKCVPCRAADEIETLRRRLPPDDGSGWHRTGGRRIHPDDVKGFTTTGYVTEQGMATMTTLARRPRMQAQWMRTWAEHEWRDD